jgi:hypothetical protein
MDSKALGKMESKTLALGKMESKTLALGKMESKALALGKQVFVGCVPRTCSRIWPRSEVRRTHPTYATSDGGHTRPKL